MPHHLGRFYEIRPKRPGWLWMAFALDRLTPIGRGEEDSKADAERAAIACIEKATGAASIGN